MGKHKHRGNYRKFNDRPKDKGPTQEEIDRILQPTGHKAEEVEETSEDQKAETR